MGESALEIGQVVAARYTLLRKLGAGRDSEVWLVRDDVSGRERAIKLLGVLASGDAATRAAFVRTVQAQQRIEHPNVLHSDEVADGERPFATFAFYPRGDLSRVRGRPWQELVPLLGGVAAGVGALHAAGLVHRDLKPANVLLTDDGTPKLADLGIAAAIGSRENAGGGSPFSASPQQLSGAEAAVADDVYGFGALAYELVSGYPPYYPDAEARARGEPLPPLRAGTSPPPALEDLITRCLAADPHERPADFATLRTALRAIAVDAGSASQQPRAGFTLQPPQEPLARIEPRWQRAQGASGPSEGQLRAQGFRRGLIAAGFAALAIGAGLVFFALPHWLEKPVVAAPPKMTAAQKPPEPAPPAEKDLQRLGAVKEKFDELRPTVGERLSKLEARSAVDWGGDAFVRARDGVKQADESYAARDLDTAYARLKAASDDLAAVEKSAGDKLKAALAAGAKALESGTADEAKQQFALALKIDAANAVAKRGAARAGTLDEVRRLLAAGSTQEQAGDRAGAEQSYRAALKLDADASGAHAGLARLQSAASASAYSAAVAEGLAALSRRDANAARAAFKRADAIRPGSPEVQDGLAQADRMQGDASIEQSLASAQAFEKQERWSDAVAAYRKALVVDANLLAAQQGVERAEPRAMLDAELRSYIDKPDRLFTPDVRNAARNAVKRAQALPEPGPVVSQQAATIDRLIASAETPVTLAITSDNITEVTIFRVGKLGMFERRDMTLLPGRYTLVGTRAGFRDVRRELTILPGQAPAPVAIRCEEPI